MTHLLQSTLLHLVAMRRPFPIPTRVKNIEALLEGRKNPNGTVLCSVHLPFERLVLRCLTELGKPPDAVVTVKAALVNGKFPLWGLTESLPAVLSDRDALVKVRTILRQGGMVVTMLDATFGEPLHCNIFRLIRLVGAQVVFFTTELQRGGEIVVEFLAPPDPFCLSDESVRSNLLVLQTRTARILQLPVQGTAIVTQPFKREVSRTSVTS